MPREVISSGLNIEGWHHSLQTCKYCLVWQTSVKIQWLWLCMTTHGENKPMPSAQWELQPLWNDTLWAVRRGRFTSSPPACRCAPRRSLMPCPTSFGCMEHTAVSLNPRYGACLSSEGHTHVPGTPRPRSHLGTWLDAPQPPTDQCSIHLPPRQALPERFPKDILASLYYLLLPSPPKISIPRSAWGRCLWYFVWKLFTVNI